MLAERLNFTWPHGVDADTAMQHGNVPLEVPTAARRRWSAMDPASRDEFKPVLRASVDAEMRHAQGVLAGLAFILGFGLLDLLLIALAILIAYKVGAARPDRFAAAGPLSRGPMTIDRPETLRAHEPPLIITQGCRRTDAAGFCWQVSRERSHAKPRRQPLRTDR